MPKTPAATTVATTTTTTTLSTTTTKAVTTPKTTTTTTATTTVTTHAQRQTTTVPEKTFTTSRPLSLSHETTPLQSYDPAVDGGNGQPINTTPYEETTRKTDGGDQNGDANLGVTTIPSVTTKKYPEDSQDTHETTRKTEITTRPNDATQSNNNSEGVSASTTISSTTKPDQNGDKGGSVTHQYPPPTTQTSELSQRVYLDRASRVSVQ